MYLIRRVYKVKPGTTRRAAELIHQIGKGYEEAGQRSPVRVYWSGGTMPGPANTVYMEWVQEKIESLVLQNQIASASGMIGKVVQGLTDDSRNVVGVVDTVQVAGDRVVLSLHNGERLAMTRVNAIAEGGVSSDAPGNATLSADLNGDGEVDVADLGIFAAQYVS